ncbi:hypothetical protein [Marinococcus sp. PL1-022]|jgi:hypothetical protein|uniref:hypothetical protein n=1 Tax=Marinococcus sp. PL1-022 TaxID=3095363 RepID=UPI00261DF245|nr:hypothetical protein [Marinococcus sp. PL1-022]MDX6154507.1 hypothetical protein [Marinococcus sp. PL1-022]
MAKNKRNIAGFGEVAGNSNINNDDNVNIDNDKEVNNEDELDNFFKKHQNKNEEKPKVKGIYFDPEVLIELDRLKNQYGRGSISEFVNAAVKKAMKEKDML